MTQCSKIISVPFIAILLFSLLLSGCASLTGDSYERGQTRRAGVTQYGTILDMAPVSIEGSQSGLGMLGGAVAGGVLGSQLGGGSARIFSGVGGALLGGLLGAGIEKAIGDANGVEIVVQLDSGSVITVVQEYGDAEAALAIGDKVRYITASDGSARVRR